MRLSVGLLAIALTSLPATAQEVSPKSKPAPAVQEVAEVVMGMVAASIKGDGEVIAGLIDNSRLFDEIVRQELVAKLEPIKAAALRVAIHANLAHGWAVLAKEQDWKRAVISDTVASERGALVHVRLYNSSDAYTSGMQLWLFRSKAGWKIYDWRNVWSPFRTTTLVGSMLSAVHGGTNAGGVQSLFDTQAALDRREHKVADDVLRSIDYKSLAKTQQAAFWLLLAQAQLGLENPQFALACVDRAEAIDTVSMARLTLRAEALLSMQEYDLTIRMLSTAMDRLGPVPKTQKLAGDALFHLDKLGLAVNSYRRGLALDPNSMANLVGMARALPASEKGEVAARFAKMESPAAKFRQLADALLASDDDKTVEQLITGSAERITKMDAAVYLARIQTKRGEHADALSTLGEYLKEVDPPPTRIVEQFLDASLKSDKAVDAYHALPNKIRTFAYLSERLLEQQNHETLGDLARAHQAAAPKDPQLHRSLGEVAMLQKQFAVAAIHFSRGLELTTEEQEQELLRVRIVDAKYQASAWNDAYERIGPPRATFDHLARAMANDKNDKHLEALIRLHFKREPADPTLLLWLAEVHWLRRDYDEVVDILEKKRDLIIADHLSVGRLEDRLVRSLVRLERHDDALKVAQRSTERDSDPWFEVVVLCAQGDPKSAETALQQCVDLGYSVEQFYGDPDVGPALRSDKLASVRERFPLTK